MTDEDLLSIQLTHVDGAAVLALRGEIDLVTAPHLRESLERACELDLPVVLDMDSVTFMDSSGIAALLTGSGLADGSPSSVRIKDPSDQIRKILAITGLDKLFLVEP